jgi:hypothetical protein
LGIEIEQLERLDTEQQLESTKQVKGVQLKVIRYDYKAVITDQQGRKRRVLIELQWQPNNVLLLRFRNYYGKELVTSFSSDSEATLIPITSIYILGHKLKGIDRAVVEVKRSLHDLQTKEILSDLFSDPFLDMLSHEFVIIQTPRLAGQPPSELDEVLFLFNTDYTMTTDNKQVLALTNVPDTPFARKAAKLANRLVSDPTTRAFMDLEDEFNLSFEIKESELAEAKIQIEEERRQKVALIRVMVKNDIPLEQIAVSINMTVEEIKQILK